MKFIAKIISTFKGLWAINKVMAVCVATSVILGSGAVIATPIIILSDWSNAKSMAIEGEVSSDDIAIAQVFDEDTDFAKLSDDSVLTQAGAYDEADFNNDSNSDNSSDNSNDDASNPGDNQDEKPENIFQIVGNKIKNAVNKVLGNSNEDEKKGNGSSSSSKEYCQVTFVTNSEYALGAKKLAKGSTLDSLPAPLNPGYIFTGWYYDAENSKAVTSTDTLNKDISLYASYMKAEEEVVKETPVLATATNVDSNFKILVKTKEASDVKTVENTISVESLTSSEQAKVMQVSGSGNDYVLSFTDKGFENGAAYRVTLNDDNLLFDGKEESVREFNITASMGEEVTNFDYAADMKYIQVSDVSDVTLDGKSVDRLDFALITTSDNGQNKTSHTGSFNYSGPLEVGDTVAIYDGIDPRELLKGEAAKENQTVSYITITKKSGSNYEFKNADADDVIFTPDVLPISSDWDVDDNDGNVLTIVGSKLDFSSDRYTAMGLDSQTTIEQGDFIALYSGDFDKLSKKEEIFYKRITDVKKEKKVITDEETNENETVEYFVICYENSSLEDMKSSMDIRSREEIDAFENTPKEELNDLSASIEKEAVESGFAEEAALYLASVAMATDEFTTFNPSIELSDYKAILDDGTEINPDEIALMAEKAKVKIDFEHMVVNASISKELKQFEGVEGVHVDLKVKVPIIVNPDGDNQLHITITGTFIQEVRFVMNVKAKAIWKVAGIIPYIADYRMTASVDVYEYTGISIDATMLTKEGDGGEGDTAGDKLANQIKELLEEYEHKKEVIFGDGEEVEINTSLTEKYTSMLENETDWLKILKRQIAEVHVSAPPGTDILIVGFEVDLNISVSANVSLGIDFEYKNAKRHIYNVDLFAKSVTHEEINIVDEEYTFDFYVMGTIGIRAGLSLEFKIGLFSLDLDSVGVSSEAGAYCQLYGYFYYSLHYGEHEGKTSSFSGALYIEVGAYLNISLNAQAIKGTFSASYDLVDKQWPLYSAGVPDNVRDFTLPQKDMPEIKLKQYIKEAQLSDDIFDMTYLELVEGKVETRVYDDAKDFAITFTNNKFKYNPADNTVTVYPEDGDTSLETDMVIRWTRSPLAFTSRAIERTIHITWDNLRDGYVIVPYTNGGSYVSIINESYGASIKKPANPVRAGYVFEGWYVDAELTKPYSFPKTMGNTDTNIYAKWSEATDTPYEVNYYQRNLGSKEYTLVATEKLKGTTNSELTYNPSYDYEGFTKPDDEKIKILADGSAKINFYYDRVTNKLSFVSGDISDSLSDENYLLEYGATISAPVFAVDGYEFEGWMGSDSKVYSYLELCGTKMGATEMTYTAQWSKSKDTEYRVEYYVQKTDGSYSIAETAIGFDESGKKFSKADLVDGHSFDSDTEFNRITQNGVNLTEENIDAEVKADGKSVIKVYYDRKKVEVSYYLSKDTEPKKEQVYVGQKNKFKPEDTEDTCFAGWYTDSALQNEYKESEEGFREAISLYASFKEKTILVVEHYVMNTEGEYGETPDGTKRYEKNDKTFKIEKDAEIAVSSLKDSSKEVEGGIVLDKIVTDADTEVTGESYTIEERKQTLKFYYRRNKYSLSWDLDGADDKGVEVENDYTESGDYCYGKEIVIPILNAKGYYYEWDKTPVATMPAENVSYTANWTETDKYSVKFVDTNGTVLSEIREEPGHTVQVPDDPKKKGYTFAGWDGDIPEVVGKSNVVITAKWTVVNYTVTYELNGGEWAEGADYKNSYTIESSNIELVNPVKKGYTFMGWKNGEDAISLITAGSTGDLALTAEWRANTYTIIFNGNGAPESQVMENQQVTTGDGSSIANNTFTREGYVFKGWSRSSDDSVAEYENGQSVEAIEANDGSQITLYAVWMAGFKVQYPNLEESEIGDNPTFFEGDSAIISLNAPSATKKGYTFVGWYTGPDFSESQKIDTITPSSMKYTVSLYANWKANQYSVTYDANLKSGSGIETQVFTYDEYSNLTPVAELNFKNPGFSFEGWSLTQDSAKADYSDNARVQNLADSGNVTLYAIWKANEYVISYNVGAGATGHNNPGTYNIETEDILLSDPTGIKDGYRFLGWFDGDTKVTMIQKGSTGNRSLCAKYENGGVYSIEYVGTNNNTSTYRIVRTLPEGAVPSKDVQHVYYRTVNGTAIGGTASAIHFQHVGGEDVYAVFNKNDGNGSYKTFTVTGENAGSSFKLGGSKESVATGYFESSVTNSSDKYYYVQLYKVISTEGNCSAKIDKSNSSYKRVILGSQGINFSKLTKSITSHSLQYDKKKITDAGFDKNVKYNSQKLTTMLVNDYIKSTCELRYFITMDVREEDNGYQHLKFTTNKGDIQWQFEMDKNKADKDWRNNVNFPYGTGNGSSVDRFTKDGNSTLEVSASDGVILPSDVTYLTIGFDGSGNGNDDWYFRDLRENIKLVDVKTPSWVGNSPLAFGKYSKGEKIYIDVVYDELIKSYNASSNEAIKVVTALSNIGIKVEQVNITPCNGQAVVKIEAVLSEDVDITPDLNNKLVSATLISGKATDFMH